MKKNKLNPPSEPIVFTRADPAALAAFDPRTKECDMNCGPHSLDPRSWIERLFLCTDCHVRAVPPVIMPCAIMCDVDVETDKGAMCSHPVTHWWHIEGKKTRVCEMHAKRLERVGLDVRPLNK